MTDPSFGARPGPAAAAEWDERYASAQQVLSGDPNGALVAEVAGPAPGRALDVGLLDADLPPAAFDPVSAVDERRPRHVATGGGSHHTADLVLRATRLH